MTDSLRITVVGGPAWKDRLRRAHEDIDVLVERAIERGLLLLEGEIKERVGGQHTGPGKDKRGPQSPRLAGPKPILNRRSADLFKSINNKLRKRGADSSGEVGTFLRYGKTHEEGLTVAYPKRGTSIKFPKRPFVRPSLEEHRAGILREIQRALQKAVD